MPQYVNRFQYICNQNRSEINLNFFHEYPTLPLDEPPSFEAMPVDCEKVAQFVMTAEAAKELLLLLKKTLGEVE